MIRRALLLAFLPALFGYGIVNAACGPTLSQIHDDAADAGDLAAKCRNEAREAFYLADAGEDGAIAAFHRCARREGLEP